MKKIILFATIVLFSSCQEGNNTPNTKNNKPPKKFDVKVNNITSSKATITWEKAIDPDYDEVSYTLKQGSFQKKGITSQLYTFKNLKENTNYTGSVTAKDNKGGATITPFSYTTKKANTASNPIFEIPKSLKNYYKDVDFNLTQKKLYDELATLTIAKHTNILRYTDRHKYLYDADEDPKNKDNVILLYSGESRYWKEYQSGGNSHSKQTFNTEHVYPKSKIGDIAITDLHHLRVCDSKINSNRSNYPFTEGSGNYKLIKGNSWYPGDEWKGDVARMIMYINLRYSEPWKDISTGGIEMLLKWNAEDPVSAIEKKRNNVIESAQGNRNPFIDNPYLATAIWGGKTAENIWKKN